MYMHIHMHTRMYDVHVYSQGNKSITALSVTREQEPRLRRRRLWKYLHIQDMDKMNIIFVEVCPSLGYRPQSREQFICSVTVTVQLHHLQMTEENVHTCKI